MNAYKRRQFVSTAVISAVCGSLIPALSRAMATKLNPTDPAAAALGYIENATKVDTKKYPAHKTGQNCASCALIMLQYSPYRPCKLFPKNVVNANGWCSAWVKNTQR